MEDVDDLTDGIENKSAMNGMGGIECDKQSYPGTAG